MLDKVSGPATSGIEHAASDAAQVATPKKPLGFSKAGSMGGNFPPPPMNPEQRLRNPAEAARRASLPQGSFGSKLGEKPALPPRNTSVKTESEPQSPASPTSTSSASSTEPSSPATPLTPMSATPPKRPLNLASRPTTLNVDTPPMSKPALPPRQPTTPITSKPSLRIDTDVASKPSMPVPTPMPTNQSKPSSFERPQVPLMTQPHKTPSTVQVTHANAEAVHAEPLSATPPSPGSVSAADQAHMDKLAAMSEAENAKMMFTANLKSVSSMIEALSQMIAQGSKKIAELLRG
jgi:hypothetical protein